MGSQTDFYLSLCCLSLSCVHRRPQFPVRVPVSQPAFTEVENTYLHFLPFLPTPTTFEKNLFHAALQNMLLLVFPLLGVFSWRSIPLACQAHLTCGNVRVTPAPVSSKPSHPPQAQHTFSPDGSGVWREDQRPINTAAGP